jgi:hypothetical protein
MHGMKEFLQAVLTVPLQHPELVETQTPSIPLTVQVAEYEQPPKSGDILEEFECKRLKTLPFSIASTNEYPVIRRAKIWKIILCWNFCIPGYKYIVYIIIIVYLLYIRQETGRGTDQRGIKVRFIGCFSVDFFGMSCSQGSYKVPPKRSSRSDTDANHFERDEHYLVTITPLAILSLPPR